MATLDKDIALISSRPFLYCPSAGIACFNSIPAIPVSAKPSAVGLLAKVDAKGPNTVFTNSKPVWATLAKLADNCVYGLVSILIELNFLSPSSRTALANACFFSKSVKALTDFPNSLAYFSWAGITLAIIPSSSNSSG